MAKHNTPFPESRDAPWQLSRTCRATPNSISLLGLGPKKNITSGRQTKGTLVQMKAEIKDNLYRIEG